MLLLRDVIYNDALFEVNVIYNHPCVCFRESRSSLNFNLSWVSQLFVVIQRQPRVWGLGGLGRGRLVVWNPRIPRESQNSKVTTGPQTIWVTIAPTKQKHPEFRIRSPEVDFFLQNSTSGIFWHPWLWGGDELKMYGQLIILNEYVGGRNQVAGRKTLLENACMNLQVSLFLTPKNHQNFWNRSSTVLFCGGIFFAEGGGGGKVVYQLGTSWILGISPIIPTCDFGSRKLTIPKRPLFHTISQNCQVFLLQVATILTLWWLYAAYR